MRMETNGSRQWGHVDDTLAACPNPWLDSQGNII